MTNNIREALIHHIDQIEPEMLQLWRELVMIESPSHYKQGVDRVGEVLANFCQTRLGYHIRLQRDEVYGDCLAACSCPFDEYKEGIAISAHMDTVHEVGSFQPVLREDDDHLYGPGAGDCKGGIILALTVALALKKIGYNKRPIKLLFAADEESGGPTGPVFYPSELPGSDYMFNAESGIAEKLVTGRKSSLIATYHICGRAAHIGYLDQKPASAISEAMAKLRLLENASDYDLLTFVGTKIQGGRVATGVADECTLTVNVRIKDHTAVSAAINALEQAAEQTAVPGTSSTLEIRGNRTPMSQLPQNIQLCELMSSVSRQLGFGALESTFVGGASDAAYASQLGIAVVCGSGPVVEHQHTLQERVLKSSMAQRAKVHAITILEYL